MQEDKQVVNFHLIVFKCSVHIKVTFIGGQRRKIKAFQMEKHGTRTETWQSYIAAMLGICLGLDSFPDVQRPHA